MKKVFGTLAGRAMVIGVAIRFADLLIGLALGQVPPFISAIDTAAAIVIAVAAVYFLARGVALMRRQLLWRVRRKLIISYVFIGVIPALLLSLFFILGGVLLFYNFAAYVVRSELDALRSRASSIADAAAAEIARVGRQEAAAVLERRTASGQQELSGVSMAVVPVQGGCGGPETETRASTGAPAPPPRIASGSWTHAAPPDGIPRWVSCSGFSGLLKGQPLVVRAVVFPRPPGSGYAVVVDVVVTDHLRQRIRQETGVELGTEAATAASPPLTSFTYLERVDWNSGQAERFELGIRLGIGEMYEKISAAPGLDGTRNVVIILLGLVGGLFLIIQMAAIAAGLALARSITGSVHELFAGTERVRQGDFTGKIAVTADDQLGELAQSFNSMTGSIEDLLRESAEKKRLEEELRIAHEIQMSLLPHGPLQMPGVSVAALCVPAREVGGDYYDFLPLDERRLGLLIADVSGKGTSAALYMAELKGLVLSLSRIHTSPRELLIQANRLIAQHLDPRSFITMTYAIVDLDARTMTYARAGHTPLIYLPRRDGGQRLAHILAPDGLVLGLKIDGGETFEQLLEEDTIPIEAGDLCLFFTDGITEAMNECDDFFGEARLARVMEDHGDLPSDELREQVLREVTAFVGPAAQHDDMTMILLKIDDLDPLSRTITDADGRSRHFG